ncbi:MAG: hypothetical protein O2958_04420 [Gemmatimonadetes bacterium]|nr:hypothetical protein [Gemmatimonadota bacterium]MDA1102551.1 hypothetical protein [Gemmatimonadota bacterium]
MSSRVPRFGWLPSLLVGASAAIVAEVAVAVLLYTGPGFVRSLTVILAVEGAALAAGLWSAPTPGADLVDRLRRRWLLCLLAFLAAALYGTAWTFLPQVSEGRIAQGIGLTILAGLPLLAAGAVLGGIAVASSSDPGGRLRGPGASAAAGAALGFIFTGLVLPRAPMPASLLLGCLVMLSLGGMVFGSVLGARMQIDVRGHRAVRGGDVSVEDRRLPIANLALRVLREGDHIRRTISLDRGVAPVPWDVSLIRASMPGPEVAWRVLLIGGGASSAARTVLREHPLGNVDVLDRTGAVVELGREYFETELAIARGERLWVTVGHLDDLVERLASPYDLVVIDTAALAPIGGVVGGLSRTTRGRLLDLVSAGGTLAWGPAAPEPGMPEVADGWAYLEVRRESNRSGDEVVVLTKKGTAPEWPALLDGFHASPAGASL